MTDKQNPGVVMRETPDPKHLPNPEEFKPNNPDCTADKRVTAVAKGSVQPPSFAKKTKAAMFANDAKEVGSYILWDLIIPALKQTISDVVTGGVERALFGDSAPRRSNRTNYSSYSTRVSYSNTRMGEYNSPTEPARRLSSRARRSFDFSEILLEDRSEAIEVIERLRDILDKYSTATVADLYDLCGISTKYTDQNWGWTRLEDLRDASYRRVRNGYILQIPEPYEINHRG